MPAGGRALGSDAGESTGHCQGSEQAGAPASAERCPAGSRTEQAAGDQSTGTEPLAAACRARPGPVTGGYRHGRGEQALAQGADDHGGGEENLHGRAAA
jgi:hypothetical protein